MADKNRGLIPRSLFNWPSSFPNLWEDVENRMGQWMGAAADTGISVSEDDKNIYVEAQLPGLQDQDLDISLHQNTLWIKGERQEEKEGEKDRKYYQRARRSFFYQVELPSQAEENSEQVNFKDGVLTLTFKKTQQAQVRKIPVGGQSKTSSQQQNKGSSSNSSNKNSKTGK